MNRRPPHAAQKGAALVIGLVLLLVLTLLAVSSMNSASLEFIMAGNEQYRSNAFQAAEAGVEQTIMQSAFDTGKVYPLAYGPGGNGTDAWSSVVTMPGGNGAFTPPANYTQTYFSTYHFEIGSTGTSTRGATALNTQGVMIVAPASPDQKCDPKVATCKLQ